jgi:hypothetical protein
VAAGASSDAGAFFNGSDEVFYASIGRELWQGPLSASGIAAPLPGYPIDQAKVLVQKLYPMSYDPNVHVPLTVVGQAVPAGQAMTQSDWDFGGSTLTTAVPTLTGPYVQNNYYQLDVPVPPAMLFAPGADPQNPTFAPEFRVQLRGPEPPSDFGADGPGMNPNGCGWAEGWGSNGINILFREQLPPLVAVGQDAIGSASFDYSARMSRLAGELRSQFDQLSQQKDKVQASLPKLRAAFNDAEKQVTTLQGQLVPLNNSLVAEQTKLAKITAVDKGLPRADSTEFQARESTENRVLQLQDQILDAQHAGNTARVRQLDAALAAAERGLAILDKAIEHKTDTFNLDFAINTAVTTTRSLARKVFGVRRALVAAVDRRAAADEALKQALDRQTAIDDPLTAVTQQLAALDFAVQHVQVTANGVPVFAADVSGPYAAIQKVNDQLDQLRPLVTRMENLRAMASADAQAAAKARSQAIEHVTEVIYGKGFLPSVTSNAFLTAGIDTLDYAWDVAKGFGEGGPIGALGAAVKKFAEATPTLYKTIWSDWGATEFNDLDQMYASELKQDDAAMAAQGTEKVIDLAEQRLLKDTQLKPIKDGLNKWLLARYEKAYGTVPDFYRVIGPMPPSPGSDSVVSGFIDRFKTYQKWATSREAALKKLREPSALEWSKLAKGFVKDIGKAAIKLYLDERVKQAWLDVAVQEANTRLSIRVWRTISDQYWKAKDLYDGLLGRKLELESGYDPNTKTRVTLDMPFPHGAQLAITLTVVRGTSVTVPLDVTVGGTTATSAGMDTYMLDSSTATATTGGVLGLKIIAR